MNGPSKTRCRNYQKTGGVLAKLGSLASSSRRSRLIFSAPGMGWALESFRSRAPRDPIISALSSSPNRVKLAARQAPKPETPRSTVVKRMRSKEAKRKTRRNLLKRLTSGRGYTPTNASTPEEFTQARAAKIIQKSFLSSARRKEDASPKPLRRMLSSSGAARSMISDMKSRDVGLPPSMQAQFEKAAAIAKVTRAFEEAGRRRRHRAAMCMQRAQRSRVARIGAATRLQRAERGRQRGARRRRDAERALLTAPAIPPSSMFEQLASHTEAMLEHGLTSRAPLELALRAIGGRLFGSTPEDGSRRPSCEPPLDAKLWEKVRQPRHTPPNRVVVPSLLHHHPRCPPCCLLTQRAPDRHRAPQVRVIRYVLDIPAEFGIESIAEACPVAGSLEQRIEVLHENVQRKMVERNRRYLHGGRIGTLHDSFCISDKLLGIMMRANGDGVVVGKLKPGSQAERLGVPIGGRLVSINGEAAASSKDAVTEQLQAATRPTTLLISAPETERMLEA